MLGHLATGADSRTMARALALSEHTVNDHVRAVLAKCDAPTRAVLLSRGRGDVGGPGPGPAGAHQPGPQEQRATAGMVVGVAAAVTMLA